MLRDIGLLPIFFVAEIIVIRFSVINTLTKLVMIKVITEFDAFLHHFTTTDTGGKHINSVMSTRKRPFVVHLVSFMSEILFPLHHDPPHSTHRYLPAYNASKKATAIAYPVIPISSRQMKPRTLKPHLPHNLAHPYARLFSRAVS